MVYRSLGNTGLSVSPIGFGAFKIGRNVRTKYEQNYDLPSDKEVERLLNGLLDLGINYIDTAPAYGTSELRIGKAITHRRDDYVLSTVGYLYRGIVASVQKSVLRAMYAAYHVRPWISLGSNQVLWCIPVASSAALCWR